MKNRALTYTIGFAAIGVIITILISYVQRKTIVNSQQNLPYASLVDNIKSHIATANLSLEQLLAGDSTLSFDRDVLAKYNASRSLLQAVYDGSETELGKFEKSDDEDTKVLLKEAANEVDHVIEAVRDRWSIKQQAATSSVNSDSTTMVTDSTSLNKKLVVREADFKLDAGNKKLLTSLNLLASHIGKKVQTDMAFLNAISLLSIVLVFVCFILLSAGIYKIQHNSDKSATEHIQQLNRQTTAVEKLSDFIEAVSAGNYAVNLDMEGDEDLTNKLITMRDKLKENTENDRRRGWSTMGLAQIGEILRVTTTNATALYDNIIRFIVKYTKSNQGGLFVINEDVENKDKTFLELVACYAYERKKFLTKKVEPGEGLVGQCFLEGERIYLKDMPEEYLSISSGLGGSKPKALLIIPMKLNGKVYGVIELATFFTYEDYEIELIEKLAENIAATISTVRTNESTRVLLETTQQQSEEMKSQEEEIRQNMEELEATQEEMRRKQTLVERELSQSQHQTETLKVQEKKLMESQDTLQAIVDNLPRAIFWKDKNLNFMGCNRIFASIAGVALPKDIIGKSDFDMPWSIHADTYRQDDLDVMNSRVGKLDIEEMNTNSDEEQSWVLTSKVPIINPKNEVVAILGMFEDITDRKNKEADLANKLREGEKALVEIQELKRLLQVQG